MSGGDVHLLLSQASLSATAKPLPRWPASSVAFRFAAGFSPALVGFSGSDAPLALLGSEFAPAMWLGLGCFAALFAFFYRRVLRK